MQGQQWDFQTWENADKAAASRRENGSPLEDENQLPGNSCSELLTAWEGAEGQGDWPGDTQAWMPLPPEATKVISH